MAVLDTRTAPSAGGTSFGRAVLRLVAAISDWRDERATRIALSRLTDRELDDIGLSRGDIDHVARGV